MALSGFCPDESAESVLRLSIDSTCIIDKYLCVILFCKQWALRLFCYLKEPLSIPLICIVVSIQISVQFFTKPRANTIIKGMRSWDVIRYFKSSRKDKKNRNKNMGSLLAVERIWNLLGPCFSTLLSAYL